MSKTIKVLFLGDLVGRPGREAVQKFLNKNQDYDFVIANVENASHGFGLTKKNHDDLISYGINCMTSGNHIWDKKDVYAYIDDSSVLVRPLNYHKKERGAGFRIFNDKIIVLNLLGKTFMQPVVCPFQTLYDVMISLNEICDLSKMVVIVDFHAEATAEKICLAHFAKSLGVSAVLGTHTHVQTADEKLIDYDFLLNDAFEYFPKVFKENVLTSKKSMAYISDVGFCGSYKSIIGMEYESSLKRLVSSIPERFDVALDCIRQINAVSVEFDFESGVAQKIERINLNYNYEEMKP